MFRRIIHYYTEGFPPRKDFPAGIIGLSLYLKKIFLDMPPGINRLFKLQPITALISGLVVTLLLRRGFEHIPFIIIFIIITFFYITFGLSFLNRKSVVMKKVSDVAVMFFINDMLLFIIPFYFESMTYFSRNIFFGIILINLAVITNWYFLFERIVPRSAFACSVYYAMVFFCVLNFLFPIVFGMRNIWSLSLSGGIAAASAVIIVYPYIRTNRNRRNALKFTSGILLSVCFIWFGRSFIPPAPLKLTNATACEFVVDHEPVLPFQENNIDNLYIVYFFSAIFAPNGLSEQINHVWYFNGKKTLTVNLSEIRGGRKDGYRTWSRRPPMEGRGKYTVEVWTAGGQLLGEGSFQVK